MFGRLDEQKKMEEWKQNENKRTTAKRSSQYMYH